MMHILTVHDHSFNNALFWIDTYAFLRRRNDCCIVGEANCLEEALSLAKTRHIDIVLLDGGLTSANPFEITWHLRRLDIQAIMVFASYKADEEELFQFLKYGATAYEPCSISKEELLVKMYRAYFGEYLVTGDVLLTASVLV